jgi:hypothetical protein
VILLFSTKDRVAVSAIQSALKDNGIDCKIVGEHTEGMLGFVQDVDMKVLVPKDDFENSVRIMETVIGSASR